MKVAIFGRESECKDVARFFSLIESDHRHSYAISCLSDYDDLRHGVAQDEYDLVVILANGAEGMEACIGTRKIAPHMPLFWFSDDPYFGPQSYRLDCTYFSTKPVTIHRLKMALELFDERQDYNFGDSYRTIIAN